MVMLILKLFNKRVISACNLTIQFYTALTYKNGIRFQIQLFYLQKYWKVPMCLMYGVYSNLIKKNSFLKYGNSPLVFLFL